MGGLALHQGQCLTIVPCEARRDRRGVRRCVYRTFAAVDQCGGCRRVRFRDHVRLARLRDDAILSGLSCHTRIPGLSTASCRSWSLAITAPSCGAPTGSGRC